MLSVVLEHFSASRLPKYACFAESPSSDIRRGGEHVRSFSNISPNISEGSERQRLRGNVHGHAGQYRLFLPSLRGEEGPLLSLLRSTEQEGLCLCNSSVVTGILPSDPQAQALVFESNHPLQALLRKWHGMARNLENKKTVTLVSGTLQAFGKLTVSATQSGTDTSWQ